MSITWVRHWSEVFLPAMFVFNWSCHSCQLPPILWSSWGLMTTIEDEEFFFFWATLGITCRLKWVVAALRGLWPRGMSRLMELMLSLMGLLGFPLVFSSFGLLNFKTSPFVFLILLRYFCFFWETSLSLVSSFHWPWFFSGELCTAAFPISSSLRYVFLSFFSSFFYFNADASHGW